MPRSESLSFDGSLDDVDVRFEEMLEPGGHGHESDDLDARDSLEIRELFGQIAAAYVRPVRDFMMELSWGDAPRDWLDVCEPAISAMRRSADKLDHRELCEALDTFAAELSVAAGASEPVISGDTKDRLIYTYAGLVSVMPHAFGLDGDRSRREPVIIQSLLRQIPDVGKVTTDKLYGAGLTSLEVLCMATAEDISFVTGIPDPLSERIVEKFREYRREIEESKVDPSRSEERRRLAALTDELCEADRAYRQLAASWDDADIGERRRLRQLREARLLEVHVLLARLGEIERLSRMERMAFHLKVEEVQRFLAKPAG